MKTGIKEFFIQEGTYKRDIPSQCESLKNESGYWKKDRLVFVGEKQYSDIRIYCYPKYLNKLTPGNEKEEQEIKDHMAVVLKVLRKLRKDPKSSIEGGDLIFDSESNNPKADINKLSVARYLIKQYLKNGIYSIENYTIGRGIGVTLWGRTVNKVLPIIQDNGDVVYTSQIRKRRIQDDTNVISRLHIHILKQCAYYIEHNTDEDCNIISLEKMKDHLTKDVDLKHYVVMLNNRLIRVYDREERALLKAMISWCDSSPYYKYSSGTTNFELVWEWVNDAVWGSVSEKNSDIPEYLFEEVLYKGRGENKPDTLRIVHNDDAKECDIHIFDAKYYVPDLNSKDGNIFGMPASSDISKQIGYSLFIRRMVEAAVDGENAQYNYNYSNQFLLPDSMGLRTYIGKEIPENYGLFFGCGIARTGFFSRLLSCLNGVQSNLDDIKENFYKNGLFSVDLLMVNPLVVYNKYLAGEQVQEDELYGLVRERMANNDANEKTEKVFMVG